MSEQLKPTAQRDPAEGFDHGLGDLPVPRPDPREWSRNFWLAMLTSPRRAANYARYKRSRRKRSTTVDYLPFRLDIEPNSRCNFRCTMCQVSEWKGGKRAEDLEFDHFRHLVDEQHGLWEIKLQGMGEPLLNAENFFRMIRYARQRHIWVRSTTNASLLHVNDNAQKLIDTGINEIQISFDGATKATFESIRRQSKFETVKANCKLINDYCASKGLVRTRMWVVVQKHNAHEFLQFVDIAGEMGFRRLTFSLSLGSWGQEKWEERNSAATVRDEVTREACLEAIRRGAAKGVEVTFWNIADKYSHNDASQLCPWPFERAYISSDLRIVPCCMIGNPDVIDLGDARSFSEAWNGPAVEDFRRAHLEGRVPGACRVCYHKDSWGVDPPHEQPPAAAQPLAANVTLR